MHFDLYNHLDSIDHGQLADLVKDSRVIELVDVIQKGHGRIIQRGKIIADSIGGLHAILLNKEARNKLFLTLSRDQEDDLKDFLGVRDVYNFNMTKDRKTKLANYFGIEFSEGPEDGANKESVGAVSVKYGLFEHQSVALLNCLKSLDSENKSVMLHMPTGAGKTRTAMHLISRYLNKVQKGVVVWLVHGIELCLQASSEFRKAWHYLGERPIPIIELWGGKQNTYPDQFEEAFSNSGRNVDKNAFESNNWPIGLQDAVIIASVDSLNSLIDTWQPAERMKRAKNVRLVIFDEAHQAVANTYKRAIECVGSDAALVGLSATPGRSHYGGTREADQELVDLFKNKVEISFEGFDSPIDALISQGYLANLEKEKLDIVNSNLTNPQIDSIRRNLSQDLDIKDSFMEIIGLDAVRNLQIVKKTLELVEDDHRRIIIFAPSVNSSDLMANLINSMGVRSKSVTSKTLYSDRKQYIDEYLDQSDSSPFILCNFGILTTGFDAPKTSAVIIARPTTSIVLLNQMAGRAIRGPKVGGNKEAVLVTVVDTSIPELVDTVNQFHAFDQSWINK